jgi:SAM-dependent MidA family methyltransferase
MHDRESVSAALAARVRTAIAQNGGWLPFDRYMALALYAPGLGYYANDSRQFGLLPESGSDFVTAPELSALFGRALGAQVDEALVASGTDEVWEFGAGSGALAEQLLDALDAGPARCRRYTIVDVSGTLRRRQQTRLARYGDRVRWIDALPDRIDGVVVGNEVLDAMPVRIVVAVGDGDDGAWHERGVAWQPSGSGVVAGAAGAASEAGAFVWSDRPTALRPAHPGPYAPGALVELHPQAEAFVATLAERMGRGAAFFIDYGFPAAEYHHPQRSGGTLMCHRGHRADADPLADIGLKDITTHLDFSALALAGQDAGFDVIGYTTQAHFLINCGLLDLLAGAGIAATANAQKLVTEHEMGELFKVIGFAKGCPAAFVQAPLGFRRGDRTHTL